MILVDSSIWIDHFTNAKSRGAIALSEVLSEGKEIGIISIVLTEVLMGFRSERSFRLAKSTLSKVPELQLSAKTYANAAALYRTLKKRGITVRGAIDCIIAQSCLEQSLDLLTLDRDFFHISEHTPLKLLHVGPKTT